MYISSNLSPNRTSVMLHYSPVPSYKIILKFIKNKVKIKIQFVSTFLKYLKLLNDKVMLLLLYQIIYLKTHIIT